ncbi:MAG: glycosyltransferase family 4 protein [Anaerolineae bacterium]
MSANYSVERVFFDVRAALPPSVEARVVTARYESRGVWMRLLNMIQAAFSQGEVNHITGDVHYLALLLKPSRTLLTVLDCVSLERLWGWRRDLLFFFWYWLPVRCCRLVSVISESTKRELLHYVRTSPSKIRVVHCPVGSAFKPNLQDFYAAAPRILQVGAGHNKNLCRVAEALQGIPCYLRVVGRLSEEQRLSLHANHIEYSSVDNISDEQLVQEYRDCDMVVFVSTYEGFGLPILEAQATGRPVVTSNTYSMPEVAGDAACMVDPLDVQDIRRGIVRVIQDHTYREGLVQRGLSNVEHFRPEAIAAQYVALYEEILSMHGKPGRAKA